MSNDKTIEYLYTIDDRIKEAARAMPDDQTVPSVPDDVTVTIPRADFIRLTNDRVTFRAERDALAARGERMRLVAMEADAIRACAPVGQDFEVHIALLRMKEALALCHKHGDLEPPATGAGEAAS